MKKVSIKSDSILGLLGSLADPTRLRLLRLLERNELGVAELCDVVQLPQSTVSRHLKVLGDLGWVRSRKMGTNHLYRTILDELEPAARKLWLVAREQTDRWADVKQDQLRLERRLAERSAAETFFAGAAAEWDHLRGQLYGSYFSTAACLAMLPESHVVADLGCGTGQISASLSPFVRKVIGVDNSPAMLKAARQRLSEADNVQLHRADLSALPIEDGLCDASLTVLALTYVTDPAAVIREAARILKVGGRGVIVDLLPHDRDDFRQRMGQTWSGFDLDQVRGWMTDAGLSPTTCRGLLPEPNVKGPVLFIAAGVKI